MVALFTSPITPPPPRERLLGSLFLLPEFLLLEIVKFKAAAAPFHPRESEDAGNPHVLFRFFFFSYLYHCPS